MEPSKSSSAQSAASSGSSFGAFNPVFSNSAIDPKMVKYALIGVGVLSALWLLTRK